MWWQLTNSSTGSGPLHLSDLNSKALSLVDYATPVTPTPLALGLSIHCSQAPKVLSPDFMWLDPFIKASTQMSLSWKTLLTTQSKIATLNQFLSDQPVRYSSQHVLPSEMIGLLIHCISSLLKYKLIENTQDFQLVFLIYNCNSSI